MDSSEDRQDPLSQEPMTPHPQTKPSRRNRAETAQKPRGYRDQRAGCRAGHRADRPIVAWTRTASVIKYCQLGDPDGNGRVHSDGTSHAHTHTHTYYLPVRAGGWPLIRERQAKNIPSMPRRKRPMQQAPSYTCVALANTPSHRDLAYGWPGAGTRADTGSLRGWAPAIHYCSNTTRSRPL